MTMDYQLSTKGVDRTFFIVDRSRMVKETDELKDAIVVYRPESDLRKVRILPRVSWTKQALLRSRYACRDIRVRPLGAGRRGI